MSKIYSLIFITILCSIYLLFSIKREVEVLNITMNEINSEINVEKNIVNILKAELAYLTSPVRLRKLSEEHLKLASLTPERMVKDPLKNIEENADIENMTRNDLEPKIFHPKTKLVKWNYKKNTPFNKNNNNIKQVALRKKI